MRASLSVSTQEKHPHIPARHIMDRIVLGGSDGAIECVAMAAALNGAGVAFGTVLIAGLAFALAGGASMFFSSYLARRSEIGALKMDIAREKMEIESEPEEERAELEALLKEEGYEQREVDVIMGRLVKNKELWLREQLRHELRVNVEDLETDPLLGPGLAGAAFFGTAILAIAAYTLALERVETLLLSVVLSLLALFSLSSRLFTPTHFSAKAGLESAAVGGVAAGALYSIGLLIGSL
ncbi:MAG: VIT1/CCC1 transporter family protein [archaeon]|nr:MAG: VIT1/CCC1 transporter family protein [archaeon]